MITKSQAIDATKLLEKISASLDLNVNLSLVALQRSDADVVELSSLS